MVLAFSAWVRPLHAQDKSAFNAADYRDDVGKGFRVADEMLAAAEREKMSLQTQTELRLQASFLTRERKQIRELFRFSDEKDVWEKRKELFRKYLSPIVESPGKYLDDPDLAKTYLMCAR